MSKLVRTVRTDFGAHIDFLSERELDALLDQKIRPYFGTPQQLRRGRWNQDSVEDPHRLDQRKRRSIDIERQRLSLCHAALAWITYPNDGGPIDDENAQRSLMLYVKPTLTGDEPEDIRNYHNKHPDFPQETTADQYFNEAQWESYRMLGEHIGRLLLANTDEDTKMTSPKAWLDDQANDSNKVLPKTLYKHTAFLRSLGLTSDAEFQPGQKFVESDPSWQVAIARIDGKHHLTLKNCSNLKLEYDLKDEWLGRFRSAEKILYHNGEYWKSCNKTMGDTIVVNPKCTVVLESQCP